MHGALPFIRKHFILTVFFSLLGLCLFLGDGQQMLIDTVGTAGVLIFTLVAHLYGKKERELPVIPVLLWGGLILYYAIRTFWSDDIGYSVYTTVRLIDAFLVFSLFYCYTTDEDRKIFPAYILGFSLFTLVTSVFFTLVPALRDLLPKSNLLVPNYGHSHVVDVLLFGIPIAFFQAVKSKKSLYFLMLILLLAGVLFSFARAAMVLVGMFLLIAILVSWKKISSGKKIAIGTVVAAIGILFSLFFIVPKSVYQPYLHTTIIPKMEKQPIGSEGRLEYFRQAIEAFKERPFFGSGPGTFILSSKRLQKAPDSYSRYAHNSILEELSNGGIIGVCFYLSLMLWCFGRLYTAVRLSHGEERVHIRILSFAIILSFVYSLLDFTMSFFVVLVLFWATVGATLSYETKKLKTQILISKYVNYTALFIVAIFYGLQLFCLSSPGPKKGILAYVYFLGETQSTDYLKKQDDMPSSILTVISILHRRNAVVNYSLAAYSKKNNTNDAARIYYTAALLDDPKNLNNYEKFQLSDGKISSCENEIDELETFSLEYAQDPLLKEDVLWIHTFLQTDKKCLGHPLLSSRVDDFNHVPEYVAAKYYLFGLTYLSEDPAKALLCWFLAQRFDPSLSWYPIEQAHLLVSVFSDTQKAKERLQLCSLDASAREHCNWILEDIARLQDCEIGCHRKQIDEKYFK